MDEILENFMHEVLRAGTYASEDELRQVINEAADVINKHPSATLEELIELMIDDSIKTITDIKNSFPIPGFTVGVNVGNIDVKLIGGNINHTDKPIPSDAMFDIASMTKFYTQIIAYNLINEGAFSFESKVSDLHPKFANVGDLTVGDILTFTTTFKTEGRVDQKRTVEEALDCLYAISVLEDGKYNYNDMGMMIMKELMEYVTGKTYETLFSEYITSKIGLNNTCLIVPDTKIEQLTGSPNACSGFVNDPKAIAVGGYSGHAGVFASSDDLIKLGKSVFNGQTLPGKYLGDTYAPGICNHRGMMGNTYTPHRLGIKESFVSALEPLSNFAIQGSTRVQSNFGKYWCSTILLNPASMSLQEAKEIEKNINEKRVEQGLSPLSLVQELQFDRGGKTVCYYSIDPRQMAPASKTVEPIITANAKLALKLRLLQKVMENEQPGKQLVYTKRCN